MSERQPLGVVSQNTPPPAGTHNKADISEEDKARYNKLVSKGKELTHQGKVQQALECNKQALAIYRSDKLAKRVRKMEEYLRTMGDESGSEEDGDDMVNVGDGFHLYRELYEKLYQHQREGVLWMWKMYKKGKGGILGDDMGLGKTIQVIAFLSGMYDSQTISSVLIILPVAVIVNWENEFENWAPGLQLYNLHGMSKRERARALPKIKRRGGVGITSYGMVANAPNAEQLSEISGREFVWDYVILDEGHKIRNPSNKCSKGVHSIPARRRMILTGTPIQNNLKEMWALFDWTHQGTLLGTARTFGMEFDTPIWRSRQKDATAGEKRLGAEMAASLQKIIAPYFLRRTKAEVSKVKSAKEGSKTPLMPAMTRKNDLICWVYLSETQQKIYEDFINSEEVHELLNSSRSPLTKLTVLKKICDHPRLLTTRQCVQLGLELDDDLSQQGGVEDLDEEQQRECAANRIDMIDSEILVRESGKMVFLLGLLDNLKSEGHRCLVFSSSRKVLNILEKVLKERGHRVARVDGTMRILQEREDVINKFTNDKSYSVFLLTTQVGGLGLTLTAADRVVIYDPSWNPATDAQAVDRAFRIGQSKNVVIYRLITCGSVEEKIYRRQIFKDSINRQTTGDSKNPTRYFTHQEIFALFQLDNPRVSTTQQQLQEMHSNQRKTDTALDAHIAFLYSLDMYGISDHDLMFSKQEAEEGGFEEGGQEYIRGRVAKAHQLLSLENEATEHMTRQQGKYRAPAVFKENGPRRDCVPPVYNPENQNIYKPYTAPAHALGMNGEEEDQDKAGEAQLDKTMEGLKLNGSPQGATPPKQKQLAAQDVINSDAPEQMTQAHVPEQDPTLANISSDDSDGEHEEANNAISISDDDSRTVSPGGDEDDKDSIATSNRVPSNDAPSTPEDLLRRKRTQGSTPLSVDSVPNMARKRRRRSVAAGLIPRQNLDSQTLVESPVVVQEELVFSPQREKPVVRTKSLSETVLDSFHSKTLPETVVDYEEFKSPYHICANSTAVVESEGGDHGDDDLDDSFIHARRLRVHRTVASSDSEDDTGVVASTPRRQNVIESSPEGTPKRSPRVTRVEDSFEEAGTATPPHSPKATDFAVSAVVQRQDGIESGGLGPAVQTSEESEKGETDEEEESHHESREGSMEDRSCSGWENMVTDESIVEDSKSEVPQSDMDGADAEAEQEEDAEAEADQEEDADAEADQEEDADAEADQEEDAEAEDQEEDEEEELTEEEQERYIATMQRSRAWYKKGHLAKALELALDGLDIYSGDPKACAFAQKLQRKLEMQQQEISPE